MKFKALLNFVRSKKYIFIAIVCLLLVGGMAIIPSIKASTRPKSKYTIVIDAGHGGRDGGSVGANGSVEKELNLAYAKTLQKLLTKAGVNVIMTRQNDNGLYIISGRFTNLSNIDKMTLVQYCMKKDMENLHK